MPLQSVLPSSSQTEPITPSELDSLKEQPTDSWSGRRDRLVMDTMFVAGLRSNEITGLARSNFHVDDHTIDVTPAKFDSERRLSLDEDLVDRLSVFVEDSPTSDYVLPDAEGGKLSTRYMRSFVSDYAKEAGLSNKRIHPHLFRHTYGSMLLEVTENLKVVQRALGHDSIQTTLLYIHPLSGESLEYLETKDRPSLSRFVEDLPPAE
jgi:integrase/recombinase XerD